MILPDGVLNINLGFPIVIICNKSDLIQFGEAQDFYKAKFDFIMTKIRLFAMNLGASIFTVSALRNINLLEFYSYVAH
jgi:translation initiation factor 2 gamma subunit (eIF-2gamma)